MQGPILHLRRTGEASYEEKRGDPKKKSSKHGILSMKNQGTTILNAQTGPSPGDRRRSNSQTPKLIITEK